MVFATTSASCYEGPLFGGLYHVAEHEKCSGGEPPPPGLLGGWFCICRCHAEDWDEEDDS